MYAASGLQLRVYEALGLKLLVYAALSFKLLVYEALSYSKLSRQRREAAYMWGTLKAAYGFLLNLLVTLLSAQRSAVRSELANAVYTILM